ncbi:MAG: hypothetical protein ACLFPN_04565 [Methanomassiliicoccales archaeon]
MNRLDVGSCDLRECNRWLREAEGPVSVSGCEHLSGVGAAFRSGEFHIEGDVGDYFGVLNDGGSFTVQGSAGRFLGDGMTAGRIRVKGDAGKGAGEYCYGGSLIIDGKAGDFLATMNKGARVVAGEAGDDVATYMVAGEVIVLGNAGERLGNFLIGGTVYVMGSYGSLGNNAQPAKLRSEDVDLLSSLGDHMDRDFNPRSFQKIVPASSKPFYRGDK